MKTTYLLLLAGFISHGLKAQDDRTAIQQWQSLHPTTLLISSERFELLSGTERALLGDNYIVFHDKISLAQLQQYDAEKNLVSAQGPPVAKDEDLKIVKDWLGRHRDVKIIPHSKYVTLNEVRLQQVQSAAYIILAGESVTAQDIRSYTTLYGD